MTNASIDYYQYWFNISQIKDLEPNKINTATLLGQKIIVWKPRFSTQYSVFLDECPYCKGPLRTGHIDDQTGNLACSYHGCQFDAQGVFTHNPQADKPKFTANNRQTLTVFNTQEKNGLLMGFSPVGKRITHHIERLD